MRRLLVALPLLGGLSAAHATLGETLGVKPGSGTASQRRATLPTGAVLAARDTTQDNGTRVREFADAQGVVYAVRWDGPTLPDLHALLGRHFAAMARAAAAQRGLRQPGTPLLVQDADVVVQSRGRMRQFTGLAYVPALVPAQVVIDDVLR